MVQGHMQEDSRGKGGWHAYGQGDQPSAPGRAPASVPASNTKVSPEEMKEPILETNFYYVVALLEGLGFCKVKDVHDGSRN